MSNFVEKLKKALKPTDSRSLAGNFIHDNEVAILREATQVLNQSETGRELLDFARQNGIAVHVIRNKEKFGLLHGDSTVYISCPAGQDLKPTHAAIQLAGALRQAQQETEEGLKRPKSVNIPHDQLVRTYVEKDKDVIWYQSAVVHELAKINGLSQIVDDFTSMGYLSLYEAFQEDIKSQGLD